MLLISEKSLIAYHLDAVCPVNGVVPNDSSRRAPQKLRGSRYWILRCGCHEGPDTRLLQEA